MDEKIAVVAPRVAVLSPTERRERPGKRWPQRLARIARREVLALAGVLLLL
ncbi:MAG: hypothetical protein H7Y32_02960, partial [Chloroflexales bacterium]|nr:hypothetical protein [Chloroflexales bacterium]